MAIQTFVASTVLTAAQMNALQGNDYNQTVSTKTASYTLVAADKGTKIVMNSASATTITVNTSLFSAGDTLTILNIAAGVCTVTAGTATVSTTGSLALAQNGGGTLYFTSAGVSVFLANGVTGGGKVLQVVTATTATPVTTTSASYVTSGLTATITPTLNTSKVLILTSQSVDRNSSVDASNFTIFRGTVAGTNLGASTGMGGIYPEIFAQMSLVFLDSPATSSAQAYTVGMRNNSGSSNTRAQSEARTSSMVLIEIGA